MNKRNLILQAAVASAIVAAFGPAHATSIGRTAAAATAAAYAGSYTIAAESTAQAYNVDLNSGAATVNEGVLADRAISGTIRWIPTFGLNSGDVCTFTFANAVVTSGDFKLLGEEAAAQQTNIGATDINGDADTLDVVEVASNFGTVDTVNGVASVQARVNNALTLPTGINLVLSETTGVDAGPNGVLDDETNNLNLRIPAATGQGNVTVASSCVTSGGLTIGAATASNTIMDLENQFNVTTQTAATSVADVGAATPRTNFLEEGAAGDVITSVNDTDLLASSATYQFNNDSDSTVEDFITLVAGDTLALTLTSSTDLNALSAVAGASFVEDSAAGVDNTGVANNTNYNFTLATPSMTSATIPGTSLPPRADLGQDDIVITVDGTTIVENRTFTGSAALNFAGAQYSDQTFSLGTTHTWTTNGTVMKAPWIGNKTGQSTSIQFANMAASAAPYTTRCFTSSGVSAGTPGTIPANTTQSIGYGSLGCAAGTKSVEFTVAAPDGNVVGSVVRVNTTTGDTGLDQMMGNKVGNQ